MFRMYIDEVGTDDLATLQTDSQKYLSLTGVVMNVTHARDMLSPALHAIKSDIFNYDPDDGLCLHRKEIMGLKGKFGALRNTDLRARFDARMLQVFRDADYTVITAFIDKPWMLRQQNWKKTHPYHYLMEILVEKYTQLLERLAGC